MSTEVMGWEISVVKMETDVGSRKFYTLRNT